jgi:hypothetical protein
MNAVLDTLLSSYVCLTPATRRIIAVLAVKRHSSAAVALKFKMLIQHCAGHDDLGFAIHRN